jgi:hypothetical protein
VVRRWRHGARLAALAAGLTAAEAAAEPPLCRASVSLEPSRAYLGQAVLHRLRILSLPALTRVEWLDPPGFPALRVERLPGRPQAGAERHDGADYRAREEQRWLFPELPGERRLPAARLLCRSASGEQALDVPGATLEVRALPAEGRPARFDGLVGRLGVQRSVEPERVALGESLRVEIRLQGGGNLWDASDPLVGDAAPRGAEVFASPPTLEVERGSGLFVRRHFRYEVVPRRAGELVLPELRVAFFDPATGRYAEARAPELRVPVAPRP